MFRPLLRRTLVIWLALAVAVVWATWPTARADGPPCNCGNGQPCVANQMYFGYYPPVWRQWPGTGAAPTPAKPQQPGTQLPPLELPKLEKELESKPNTSGSETPGATNPAPSGGTPNGAVPNSGQNPVPGAAPPAGPGNPPQPNTPQNLNQIYLPTDPQAYYPPPNLVRPAYSQINVRPSPAGVWPPTNELRESQLKAQYQVSDEFAAPRFNPIARPAASAPYVPAPPAANPAAAISPAATPGPIVRPELATGPFATSILSSSSYARPLVPLESPTMAAASVTPPAIGKSGSLLPTGPLAAIDNPPRGATFPQPNSIWPPARYSPASIGGNPATSNSAPPVGSTADVRLADKGPAATSSFTVRNPFADAPTAHAEPSSKPASDQVAASRLPAPLPENLATAPAKTATTDLFAASPLSTAVLASASVPRPYGSAPLAGPHHASLPAYPAVVLAPVRPASVRNPIAADQTPISPSATVDRLPEMPATTAVAINRSAPWISLPSGQRDDLLDLRGLPDASRIAQAAPGSEIQRRSTSLANTPPAGPPAVATDQQPWALAASRAPRMIPPGAPSGAASAWANDRGPTISGAAQFIPAQLPPPQASLNAPARNAIFQQPVLSGSPQPSAPPLGAIPNVAATARATDAGGVPSNQLRPSPGSQTSGPAGGTWSVASDQGRSLDNRPAARIWAIDPRAIESSLASDKQPSANRLPSDNSLPTGQFQLADGLNVSGPQPLGQRDPRSPVGAPLPQESPAGHPRAVRQTDFQVAQPTGETTGLSGVDPLAVSRSLAVAPALPTAPPGLIPLPPIGPPAPSLPLPRPAFAASGAPPAMGAAIASDARIAPLPAAPLYRPATPGTAFASDAGSAPRPPVNAYRAPPAGTAFASDTARAPADSPPGNPQANPLRDSGIGPGRRGGEFSAPDWSQMPDSVIGANGQNPLR